MENELISIIIPTYGRSISLEKAIESAINQTYKNIEVIVVDDNEPSSICRETNELLMEKLCKKYDNLKYIKHSKNKNGAAARNTGIDNSNGEFIAFLDDDDVFYKNKIELQYNYLKRNEKYKCVGCGYIQKGKEIRNIYSGNLSKEILTLDYCFTTSMLFFERQALLEIGKFDETFIRHQDYELLLKYFKRYEIGYLDEILLVKGINNGENIPTGKKAEDVKKRFLSAFEDVISDLEEKNHGYRKKVYVKNYFELIKSEIKGKHFILALKYIMKVIFISPTMFIKEIYNTITNRIKRVEMYEKFNKKNNVSWKCKK